VSSLATSSAPPAPTGQTTEPNAYRNDHGALTDPWDLIQPTLTDAGVGALVAAGIARSTAFAAIKRRTPPRDRYDVYLDVADAHATANLDRWGVQGAQDPLARIAQYLRERNNRGENIRRCEWCGAPMPPGARAGARYHTDTCRQAARRARPGC
jgi:hypothetical protein